MSQADEVRSNSDTFHEPEPAAALNVTTAAREWIAATLSRSWRARMQRLTWHILSPGSQEDSPDLLIAAARAFLALTSLLAIWLDSTEPARLASVARGLLLLYCVYSAAVFVFEKKARSSVRYGVIVHIGDIVWAAAITSVTEGPNSPFFLFFLFVVMAAAYRWNIRRVMWTAASLIGVLAAQAAILRISVVHSFVGTDYDTNRLIMRAAYLLVGSVVIGYIASNEKRLIREAAFVGSVVSLPRAERGLKRSAQMVLCEIARFFCAPKAAMLIRIHGGSTYLLECTAGDTEKDWTDLSPAEVEPWLFSVAANCAWVVRNAAATNLLDRTARWRSRKSRGEVQLPLRFVETNRFKDLLLANLVMADDWSGRIFLFDPQPQSDPRSALDLLDRIVRQVTPAVHNVYLLKRIRGRAQAAQRVRLAHDLHDGAMQALVAACYQLEILQRNSALPFEAAAEVRKTEEMVRKEVGSLRVLMQDLHARSLKEPDFAANLLEMINDFRGYAEIDITLSWDPATVKMPASVARETLKIIQEGLLNIHKHSGAKHATVELSNAGSQLQITIEDDGVGLEFDGRLEIRNLEELRIGPRVIRQRLQDLGGNLAIESHLDRGTRLEIGIPLRQHAAAVRQGSGAR